MDEITTSGKYYTATFDNLDAVRNKIGALDASNKPRWLIPEEQRYNDPNNTDSYHANYIIKLHEEPYEQDLYNMLKVGNSDNYYRLKKSRIIARDPRDYKNAATISANQYILVPDTDYDFSDVILNIQGEKYRYSDHELTKEEKEGGFVSYYTVSFEKVVRQDRINGSADWYVNREGWLDGAEAEYGAEGNDVLAYHRNYKAILYKGTISAEEKPKEEKSVTISSDWPEDKPAFKGTKVTLTAHPKGFDDTAYTLQWQWSDDLENWQDIEGATNETFTYEVNEETMIRYWRVKVIE